LIGHLGAAGDELLDLALGFAGEAFGLDPRTDDDGLGLFSASCASSGYASAPPALRPQALGSSSACLIRSLRRRARKHQLRHAELDENPMKMTRRGLIGVFEHGRPFSA
jgi:hypothetical protein